MAAPVEQATGTATLGDLTKNDCNLQLKPGALAFLVSPKSSFVKAPPGTTAAENGLCGRSDGNVFVTNGAGTTIASLSNFAEVFPVGFCNECGPEDIIVNQAVFDALGFDSKAGVIKNVFPTIA
ncbi:hypothetical protein V5O48_014006 [Marasmius crinis-equi]|uniref:Uncharacterized protein n=1 Tax=Marasmius crinis-equi TaxID=585013 RepID=A0ABR3EYH0_9AGAR